MNVILAQLKSFLYGEKSLRSIGRVSVIFDVPHALRLMAALAIPALATAQGLTTEGRGIQLQSTASAPVEAAKPGPRWIKVPRITGRLTSKDLGLVINTADPYSVEVGESYIKARHLAPSQVLRVQLPVRASLTVAEFKALTASIDGFFTSDHQALALAWRQPFSVGCNGITAALALGYDAALCANTCAPSALSRYFDNPSVRPYSQLTMRLSMLLAARDAAMAKAMIERGVASDASLGLRGGVPVGAYFVSTDDKVRSVRSKLFPPAGPMRGLGVDVQVRETSALDNASRVLLYETGAVSVPKLDTIRWVPGALADHLTSFGGQLGGGTGQMPIIDWIASGATASYGTVSEPCAHPQKFPHPQVLLLNYLQGATAIEAYWRSVAWPQQGVFIGEPLAAPFARR